MVRVPRIVLLLSVLLIWASHPALPERERIVLDRCRLEQPVAVVGLPPALREVSGLAGLGPRVLAHEDETGVLYAVDPVSGEIVRRWELRGGPRQDFEGVAWTGSGVVLMTSRGELFALGGFDPTLTRSAQLDADGEPNGDALPFERIETGFGRHCELEGLAYDARTRVLLLPCKAPLDPRYEGSLILLRWSPERGSPADPGQIVTPASAVTRSLGVPRIRPTAVEWDSVSGRFLVLSADPRALLDIDADGRLVAALGLDPQRHRQPEGVALVGDRLVIADEGSAAAPASLTSYPCTP